MNSYEQCAYERGYKLIAGIDEAGRGPLAGPVVAAAVILPPDYKSTEINDSKKLTARKRERLYEVIRKDALSVGIGVVDVNVIDALNIYQASLIAMKDAVSDLSINPDYLLIDGTSPLLLSTPQESVVKGDSLSISIASASIIAKVSRDRIMEIYHRQYPQYNFLKNKGYGTVEHRAAIEIYGLCKIHRSSFILKRKKTVSFNAEFDF